jgi:ATP-dependent HslUV protease ATP-binding subunit HslU
MRDLTPRQIVAELDGTSSASTMPSGPWPWPSAIAGGGSNCPRRCAAEIAPKNILMIGPTGVGKTEIARRLAKLTGAPFIKVEATKYTEVGYYGRDVESMVRELVENAIALVKEPERQNVEAEARRRAEERLLDLLAPPPPLRHRARQPRASAERHERTRQKCAPSWPPARWKIARSSSRRAKAVPMMLTGLGMEQVDVDLQGMFEKMMPKNTSRREMTVAEARGCCSSRKCEALINQEKGERLGDRLAENLGIIFLDEIDKVVASDNTRGPTSRARACSATCCRSSKARPCRRSTAT